MAYKKSLLSSLIPIRHEDTVDSFNDLGKSSLPFLLMKGHWSHQSISLDSRPIMRRIFNRSILVSFDEESEDGIPKWAHEMWGE